MNKAFRKLCRAAGRAIADYEMICDGDRLLLGMSGGLDSSVMLYVLQHLQQHAPIRFGFEAVTFDPGFPGFDACGTAGLCESLGVKHHLIRLNVPDLLESKSAEAKPCVLCSRVRRGNLYALAEELHCGKLVLAQHLDDVIASFLISLTRGGGLTTMGPNVPADDGRNIRVIRPFIYAPETLVKSAAREFELPVRGECIYHEELEAKGDRAWAERLISDIEKRIPDVRENILHSLSDIRPGYLLDKRFLKQLHNAE